MKRFVLSLAALALSTALAVAQQPGPPRPPGNGQNRFVQMEQKALAEAFVGITADGKIDPDLFKITPSGVSTQPVQSATLAFLDSLSESDRAKTTFPIGDDEWRKWANQHSYPRQGMSFAAMSEAQRKLAFAMIGAGLSAKGLKTTQDIMKLNHTIGEMSGRLGEEGYGQWAYYLTVMGEPSDTEPWGWQFDGHHCVINYFVLGDQVVMTPHFLGSEPVRAESGKFEGTVVLQDEQNAGLAFALSLTAAQREKAVIQKDKDGTNLQTDAFHDNEIIPYAGIAYGDLNPEQQKGLVSLIEHWITHMAEGHARVKMEEVKAQLDRTRFAWIGDMQADSVFYYRIHSPVVMIEFDHQRPIALGRGSAATRQHIHATIRTPNGNDYGKDLLRQHLLDHPH